MLMFHVLQVAPVGLFFLKLKHRRVQVWTAPAERQLLAGLIWSIQPFFLTWVLRMGVRTYRSQTIHFFVAQYEYVLRAFPTVEIHELKFLLLLRVQYCVNGRVDENVHRRADENARKLATRRSVETKFVLDTVEKKQTAT
jgi:hypothetical protein